MKKKFLISVVLMVMLVLAACSTSSNVATQAAATSASATEANSATTPTTLNTSYTDAASVKLQLLYGTLKLEGTEQAVTNDQASVLLPLWQSLQITGPGMGGPGGGPGGQGQAPSDNGNGSATPQAPAVPGNNSTQAVGNGTALTQEQEDALLAKIMAAMTSDQIQAIASMKVSQTMIDSYVSSLNQNMGNGQQQPGNGSNGSGQRQGNPPTDNGNGTGNNAVVTPSAGQQANMTTNMLLNEVLRLLQQKTGTSQSSNVNSANPPTGQPGGVTGGSSNNSSANITSAYTVAGQAVSETGKTYSASSTDQSAILVTNGGSLTLSSATVTTTGNTSSNDNSSFYGQNAAALAQSNSTLVMSDSSITTTGSGANGAFAAGSGAQVTLNNVTIDAKGDGGHAVMATQGGSMTLTNVNMITAGGSSSAIATDRGGGVITVNGGTVKVSGNNSAGIYSTGSITVTGATIEATGAEAAVIEGANSITLKDTSLTSSFAGKWGVMIYQSMSGDAQGNEGTFTMTGGSLAYSANDGPLFYVTNTTANISLSDVSLATGSGVLLRAEAGEWGNSGSNGGTVNLVADNEILPGSIFADNISSVSLSLTNGSSLTGSINSDKAAKAASISLDKTSTWTLTANSYVTIIADSDGISGASVSNIHSNGFNVYYDSSANPSLNGQTYTLNGGGYLLPAS